jgi:hypothetical protein
MRLNSISPLPSLKTFKWNLPERYIGIKFVWHKFPDGTVSCRLSQEGYAAAFVEEMGLSTASKSPMMTPFRSGLPVDTILTLK